MSHMNFPLLPISNASPNSEAAWLHYTAQLLGYGPDLREIFTAADAEPCCCLLQANAAILHLAFEGQEGWAQAAPYLDRMRRSATGLTEREILFVQAVEAWAARQFRVALGHFLTLTEKWPEDLVAIKWGQYHAFNLGDQACLLELGERAVRACPNHAYVHGLLAFGLEQAHQLARAEDEAMLAVEIALDDAWAHHAVAHVMETNARAEEGSKWLGRCSHIWDSKGTFIREHNWWHLALFHLALGNSNEVLTIFDERLWGEWPEFPQEQIGAASMLWRLELAGIDAGNRWQPIVEQVRCRTNDKLFPFHDLHYLFALACGGDVGEAEKHLGEMEKFACCDGTCPSWRDAALPAAKGILAYAQGNSDMAADCLSSAIPHLEKIGGSHAQRAIFHETLAAARKGYALRTAVAK